MGEIDVNERIVMKPYDYIDRMIKNGKIKRGCLQWLSSFWAYMNNGEVYKYVLQWDYRTLRKAKKHGINSEFEICKDDVRIVIDDEKIKNGKMMMRFNVFNKDITYWSGEDW